MSPRLIRGLLAGSAVAAVATAVISTTGGGVLQIGPVILRSHDPMRPAIVCFLLLACAFASGPAAVRQALDWWWTFFERRTAPATLCVAVAAVATGLVWGTFVAGGSDSYCYLNQAELFTRGAVRDYEPLATDPGWPGNVWSFAPAGHVPARNDPGFYVPICPAGYPLLLAAARILFGRTAMFWVTPLLGGCLVYLAFVLGRRAAGPAAGLLAALLTLTSPVVLYQMVQPMNDIAAATFWSAALVLASSPHRGDTARAVLSGVASGFALTIRPNLVPLAGVVALGAAWLSHGTTLAQRAKIIGIFSIAVLPGIGLVMAVQAVMYGSPLSSGYGDLSALFALSNVIPNLRRYPVWLMTVHTPLVLMAFAAPFVLKREVRPYTWWLLMFAAVTCALYLPYVVFDAWWYLRFLLPAIPLVLALTSGVLVELLYRMPSHLRVVTFVATCVALSLAFVHTAIRRDAFLLERLEWRFRSSGEYVATLPANAAVITNHHSGSVRFYSGRRTAGWGDIEPGRLDDAVRFLQSKGLKPYLLLEEWEEPDFERRFSNDRLGKLDWPPVAEIDRVVRIYDPMDYERHRSGERVKTAQIVTKGP